MDVWKEDGEMRSAKWAAPEPRPLCLEVILPRAGTAEDAGEGGARRSALFRQLWSWDVHDHNLTENFAVPSGEGKVLVDELGKKKKKSKIPFSYLCQVK